MYHDSMQSPNGSWQNSGNRLQDYSGVLVGKRMS